MSLEDGQVDVKNYVVDVNAGLCLGEDLGDGEEVDAVAIAAYIAALMQDLVEGRVK